MGKLFVRVCDACGCGMNEGFCIDNGFEYFCSKGCLEQNMTMEEYMELYDDGEGDSYYTDWYEVYDEQTEYYDKQGNLVYERDWSEI